MAYRLRPAKRSDEPAIWKATMETVWMDVPEDERPGLDRRTFEEAFRDYAADFVEGRRGDRFIAEDEAGRPRGDMILGGLRPVFSPPAAGVLFHRWVSPD